MAPTNTDLVLHAVFTAPGQAADVDTISRRMELTPEQVQTALRALTEQGYVVAEDDGDDRFYTTIGATADAAARVDPVWTERNRAAFAKINPDH